MKNKDDAIVSALKKRFFELCLREQYPHTPSLTQEIDHLQTAIREMLSKDEKGYSGGA